MLADVSAIVFGQSCFIESAANDQPERHFTFSRPMRVMSIARGRALLWLDFGRTPRPERDDAASLFCGRRSNHPPGRRQ